jgi:hypothetical protein
MAAARQAQGRVWPAGEPLLDLVAGSSMITAKPLAGYGTNRRALASGSVVAELHHHRGRDHQGWEQRSSNSTSVCSSLRPVNLLAKPRKKV